MTTIVENNEKVLNLPVIALRGLVVFPNLSIQFDVGRKKSILAITDAMEKIKKFFWSPSGILLTMIQIAARCTKWA